MIGTIVMIGWTSLKRDRVALALSFVLPVAFFSIFAAVFGGSGKRMTARVRLAIADEDRSEATRRLVAALGRETSLRVVAHTARPGEAVAPATDRAGAEAMVREGEVPVALILPRGIGAALARFGPAGDGPRVLLISDDSDPIAPQVVLGMVQKVAMSALGDVVLSQGMGELARWGGPLTPAQDRAVAALLPKLRDEGAAAAPGGGAGLVPVEMRSLPGREDRSLVGFYAAGIGVMFLLFSVSRTSGALLDEVDSGTLERLLGTRLGMAGLLAGKWLFLLSLGVAELCVLFAFGALAFGLDLGGHVPGLLVMTVVTAAAAAAFGLVLAALCRTRAQLSGLSTIVVLMMSAVGGSMFPRSLMSESMQKAGLLTFNGWAIDGFTKVLWRDGGVLDIAPQALVLSAATVVFLATARRLLRRWETS